MTPRRFRKEVVPAGFAAEAQAVMVVGDKAQLSATACAAILEFPHEAVLRLEVDHAIVPAARVNTATNSSHRPTRLHRRYAPASDAALRRRLDKQGALPRDFRRINVWQ